MVLPVYLFLKQELLIILKSQKSMLNFFQTTVVALKQIVSSYQINHSNDELVVITTKGEFKTKLLVNCGGLYCDRIAKLCGVNPGLQIVPFRGEYYKLKKEKEYLVK